MDFRSEKELSLLLYKHSDNFVPVIVYTVAEMW